MTVTATPQHLFFNYSGGFYHIGERDFRGFNEVSGWGPVSDGKQIRSTTWFHQGSDIAVDANDPKVTVGYTKGKPYRTKTWGVTGVVTGSEAVTLDSSNLVSETTTSYQSPASSVNPPFFTPQLQVDNYLYDGSAIGTHTKSIFGYGDYGNVTREERYGDVANPANKTLNMTIIRSFSPNVVNGNWLVGFPTSESVYQGIGTADADKVSHTDYYYDDLSSCTATPTGNKTPVKGNLTRVKRSLDGVDPEQWTAYDDYGNVVCSRDPNSVKDPLGKSTTITYDSTNTFPLTVTNPLQHTTTTKYYGVGGEAADNGLYGQVKSVKDPNNATSTLTYDKLGRKLVQTSQPDGFWSSWTYNYSGLVGTQYVRTDNAAGLWSTSYFDGLGRTFKAKKRGPDSKVIVAESRYDARGAVTQTSSPYFEGATEAIQWTQFTYDAAGRKVQGTTPDNKNSRACYTPSVTVAIDENNHRKRQTSDSFGRLVKVEEYLGTFSDCTTAAGTPYATTTYKYDILGSLTLVTDTKGNKSEMLYDALGRKYWMKDPDMGEWSYEYDANSNLKLQTDAKQQKIKFGYDALNRLKTKDFGADNIFEVTNTYDTYDDPTKINGIGRHTSMVDGSGSTKYYYDNLGRVTSNVKTVDGTSYTTSFAYELGRLKSITYPDNETLTYRYDTGGNLDQAIGYVTYAGFNALGQPGSATYGNGVVTNYDYVLTNKRLNSIITTSPTQGGLINLTYGYDNKGNITSIADSINSSIPHNFVSESFTPDPVRPHAVGLTGSGRSFHYDSNGNMESDGLRSVVYNVENMPTSINDAVYYTYDGNGQRVKKSSASASRVYIGNLYECSGGVCGKYIFVGKTRIALKRGPELFYYHQDHLGSTVAVTYGHGAAAGTKAEAVAYYPFGETRSDTGGENLNHKYTSQESDYEIGLYNYNARLYDPELGRFVSPDSIVQAPADPQTLNRYNYTRNNPMLYTDPTGHWFGFDDLVAVAVGAVVGGVSAAIQGGNIWQGMAIGAASAWVGYNTFGLASGAVESMTGSSFAGGAVGGAVGGAAGGATAGGMYAAVYGQNIGDGMLSGAQSGAIAGGITGGLISLGVPHAFAAFGGGYASGGEKGGLYGALSVGIGSLVTMATPYGTDEVVPEEGTPEFKRFSSQNRSYVAKPAYNDLSDVFWNMIALTGNGYSHTGHTQDITIDMSGRSIMYMDTVGFPGEAYRAPGQYNLFTNNCTTRFDMGYWNPSQYAASSMYPMFNYNQRRR